MRASQLSAALLSARTSPSDSRQPRAPKLSSACIDRGGSLPCTLLLTLKHQLWLSALKVRQSAACQSRQALGSAPCLSQILGAWNRDCALRHAPVDGHLQVPKKLPVTSTAPGIPGQHQAMQQLPNMLCVRPLHWVPTGRHRQQRPLLTGRIRAPVRASCAWRLQPAA